MWVALRAIRATTAAPEKLWCRRPRCAHPITVSPVIREHALNRVHVSVQDPGKARMALQKSSAAALQRALMLVRPSIEGIRLQSSSASRVCEHTDAVLLPLVSHNRLYRSQAR